MYMMPRKKWTIATAREQLAALIVSAAREPQRVYRRDKLVATVVGPDAADQLETANAKPRMAEAIASLHQICADENYELPTVPRRDRRHGRAR